MHDVRIRHRIRLSWSRKEKRVVDSTDDRGTADILSCMFDTVSLPHRSISTTIGVSAEMKLYVVPAFQTALMYTVRASSGAAEPCPVTSSIFVEQERAHVRIHLSLGFRHRPRTLRTPHLPTTTEGPVVAGIALQLCRRETPTQRDSRKSLRTITRTITIISRDCLGVQFVRQRCPPR